MAGTAAALSTQRPLRILCAREYQTSIKDSIHQLLVNRIVGLDLQEYFDVTDKEIRGTNGTTIGFAGIKSDPGKIKGWEDADICLIEEADKVSKESWKFLVPTIRNPNSEIWCAFNPMDVTDPTYVRFVAKPLPSHLCRIVKMNWYDNPWFPESLKIEREILLAQIADPDIAEDEREQLQADYDHIWEGFCQKNSNASVFRRRVVIEEFEPPASVRFHFGADWGFANDPTAGVRFWITDHVETVIVDGVPRSVPAQELWIDYEAFGYRVEIDETPKLFDTIPGARQWPWKGDCSRPETISYMAKHGFNITAAEKWSGSLEDGVAHVKAFRKIHIHRRCSHMQEEARLYAYKVDKVTSEVLPIILDKNNHGWDAVRYGLDGYIQRRGAAALWAKLAGK